jgi:hypothetical protein
MYFVKSSIETAVEEITISLQKVLVVLWILYATCQNYKKKHHLQRNQYVTVVIDNMFMKTEKLQPYNFSA